MSLGPVSLVSPVVAGYPIMTLAIGAVLLRAQRLTSAQVLGVAFTVTGVVLLLAVR